MSVSRLPDDCDRARASVSAELDGELPELARAHLRWHLTRCGSCRDFRTDVAAFTDELRSAPLEQTNRPVVLPSRRRGRLQPLRVAAGAAAVLAVALGSLLASAQSRDAIPGSSAPRLAGVNEDQDLLRQLRAYKRIVAAAQRRRVEPARRTAAGPRRGSGFQAPP